MSDLTDMLDQLDEAREKATPGEWFARDMEVYSEVGGTSTVAIEVGSADAALIVAAVNALPKVTAAVRAVEALAEELANPGLHAGLNNVADRIRAAIAGPLAGQHTTDEEGR